MVRVQVQEGFRVELPEQIREHLHVGDEVVIAKDEAGRIIIISPELLQDHLRQSFGIWAGRSDIPDDGVAFMDDLRKGTRLDEVA